MAPYTMLSIFFLLTLLFGIDGHVGGDFWGKLKTRGGHEHGDERARGSMAAGIVPARGPSATAGCQRFRHIHQHTDGSQHVETYTMQHAVDPCMSCECAVEEFRKVSAGPCATYILKGQVTEFCDSPCRHQIKLRAESLAHHCASDPKLTPVVREELEDMTKQHALMCHKEEGEYCVPKIRSVLKLGLEDVNWAAATEANKTVDVLCHRSPFPFCDAETCVPLQKLSLFSKTVHEVRSNCAAESGPIFLHLHQPAVRHCKTIWDRDGQRPCIAPFVALSESRFCFLLCSDISSLGS